MVVVIRCSTWSSCGRNTERSRNSISITISILFSEVFQFLPVYLASKISKSWWRYKYKVHGTCMWCVTVVFKSNLERIISIRIIIMTSGLSMNTR